jgi:hypothetical protein
MLDEHLALPLHTSVMGVPTGARRLCTQERGHRDRSAPPLGLAGVGPQMHPTPRCAPTHRCGVRFARDPSCAAHLRIRGYGNHVVCAVHADQRTRSPGVSVPARRCLSILKGSGKRPVPSALANGRAAMSIRRRGFAFAAAIFERGHVVGALGRSGGCCSHSVRPPSSDMDR